MRWRLPDAAAARRRLGLRTWSTAPVEPRPVEVPGAVTLPNWVPTLPDDDLVAFDQTAWQERAWVCRHVAEEMSAGGAVVELGSWLGSITLAAGEGIRRSGRDDVEFHTYDRFRLEDQAHIFAGRSDGFEYREGASFRDVFDRRIASVADLVTVHEGDVAQMTWDAASPVDLLFNDVSKTWATWLAVRRTFYAALRPGSLVVEQDFAHPYTPWLHLSHHRWRSWFDVEGVIPGTASLVLRLRRPLPAEELWRNDLLEGCTPLEIQEAFDWAESLVEPGFREQIAAARVMLYVLHGDVDVAAGELFKAVSDGTMGATMAAELLPGLAERAHAERRARSEAGARVARKEARLIRSRVEPARKRGDDWRAS